MTRFASSIAAAALAVTAAAPAAAQYDYQQPLPLPLPGTPYPNQPYDPGQAVVGAIVDSLIGNRYDVSDRQAIRSCANAAVQRARSENSGAFPLPFPGYNNYLRVTAITDVERRSDKVRVRGTLGFDRRGDRDYDRRDYDRDRDRDDDRGWGRDRDLSFRCDVDYRGYVRSVRVGRDRRGY
jgi:hypothetical protein